MSSPQTCTHYPSSQNPSSTTVTRKEARMADWETIFWKGVKEAIMAVVEHAVDRILLIIRDGIRAVAETDNVEDIEEDGEEEDGEETEDV